MPGRHRKYMIHQFAVWVAGGGKVATWCKEHKINVATGYRWYRDEEVRRLIEEYRGRAVDRAIGKIARNLGKAVEKIVALIEEGQTDAVKLGAAKALVEKLIDVQNRAEFRAELKRLDERLRAEEERRACGTSAWFKNGHSRVTVEPSGGRCVHRPRTRVSQALGVASDRAWIMRGGRTACTPASPASAGASRRSAAPPVSGPAAPVAHSAPAHGGSDRTGATPDSRRRDGDAG